MIQFHCACDQAIELPYDYAGQWITCPRFGHWAGAPAPAPQDSLAALALAASTKPSTRPRVVFGEACRLGAERLKRAGVTFRHIPYQIR